MTNPGESPGADGGMVPGGARADFLRLLAHELRNYVAPIHNAMHLMRLKSRSDPTLAPVIDIVERQLAGMTRALDAVSDADRIARGQFTLERAPTEVTTLVQRAEEAVRALLDARRHRLEVHGVAGLPPVHVDAGRIARALAALLDNAARYGADGTPIMVECTARGDAVEITITDRGPGMSAEQSVAALEFFGSPHRPGQGLGLGLPLAAAVVRMHGGDIALEQPDGGLRVRVSLPVHAAKETASRAVDPGPRPEAPGAAAAAARGRRVLIADDSAAVRASLADLLREMGHDVRAAADGEEAVAMAQAWNPEFVLLDIHMPRLSGFGAARKLRALYPRPGMQLVMMSGDGLDDAIRRGATEAGFDHCIDKGLAIGELTDLLARGR